jgi:hypothetical protein
MKKILEKIWLLVFVVILTSCNIDDEYFAPKIILDNETGIYTVKYGREIVVKPSYEHAEKATYCWTMEGEVLGISPSLSFSQQEVGEYFITLKVTTEYGSDEEEIRIDVVELEIPTVSIAGNKKVTVTVGAEVLLNATVRETSLPTKFAWTVNDVIVSNEHNYTFVAKEIGNYIVKATAKNDDGAHSDMVEVEVVNPEDIPFTWDFAKYKLHTVVGRKLLISPLPSNMVYDVKYSWNVQENESMTASTSDFVFISDKAGVYHINAVATKDDGDNPISITRNFEVTVYEEKEFYRPKNGASQADWNKVFEYTPAPGQFINELKTGGFDASHNNPEAAITYAEGRLSEGKWISLGGFGGYLVVGFDHSIDNNRSYNLGVVGNAFDGSSEPGIVWVMQDENGNGYPDDTWYELAGSETGKFETYRDYAVTYYRPSGIGMPVQWTDNYGNNGEIDYLAQYHDQDYYYPLWIGDDSYTLKGTRLEARNYDQSGNGTYWVQPHYDWGYVDNFSPTDFNSSDKANFFKISNAIDFEGNPVNLSHIDFVKVQCAVNAKSGWLGELSTEVCGFYDKSLKR